MKTATFKIEGMRCDGCAQTIRTLISTEPGVRATDVSFKEGQARILYEPQTISEEQLVNLIEKGGYRLPARET